MTQGRVFFFTHLYTIRMHIAIISDTHDNIPNIKKALDYIREQGITTLLHCGDTSTLETIAFIRANFAGEIYATLGNDEKDPEERRASTNEFTDFTQFEGVGEIELGGKQIAFVHYPDAATTLAHSGRYDAVFYGHTHLPWEKRIGECHLLNPGNLAGVRTRAAFAIYDLDHMRARLVVLDTIK